MIALPALICLVGATIFKRSSDHKWAEIGKTMFWVGLSMTLAPLVMR